MATSSSPDRGRTERVAEEVGGTREQTAGGAVDDRLREAVADTVSRSVDRRIDRQLDRVRRLEQIADGLETLALWLRDEPGRRRPRFSREDIAEAALRLVDAEGIDALSMRRLASELGAGTMTLYHYVKTKDEVMALMGDAVVGELLLDDEELAGMSWRPALKAIAARTRDVLLRHPWAMDVPDGPRYSPNAIRHFDQSLGALAGLPLDLEAKLDIITAVDEYVFGYCVHRRSERPGSGDPPVDTATDTATATADEAVDDAEGAIENLLAYVAELVAGGGYPNLADLLEDDSAKATLFEIQAALADPHRFERNLDRLLSGIAVDFCLSGSNRAIGPEVDPDGPAGAGSRQPDRNR